MKKKESKILTFDDFTVVKYTQTGDEYLEYQAQKRRRGHYDTWGDDYTPEGEQIDEVLNRQQRMAASRRMKRLSKKIQRAKQRALKRAPSTDVVDRRAKKQARVQMMKKLSRGQDKSDLSFGRRQEIEKRLKKMGPRIDKLAKRLRPEIRKQDRERRAGKSKSEEK